MDQKERLIIATLFVIIIITALLLLGRNTLETIKNRHFGATRVTLSHDYFYSPTSSTSLAADGDLSSFWRAKVSHLPVTNSGSRSTMPPEGTMFFQSELGLSHFPGKTPQPNMPSDIVIWSGAPGAEFYEYSRPKKVRVIIFEQQVVDIDREFRIPDMPVYLAEQTFTLKDVREAQTFRLSFLPPAKVSKKFPENIKQLWYRLEFLSFYPGKKRDIFAIREVDYQSPEPNHPELLSGRSP